MMLDCLLESGKTGVVTYVANCVIGKRISRSNNIDKKLVDICIGLTGGMKYSSLHSRREISTTHDTAKSHCRSNAQRRWAIASMCVVHGVSPHCTGQPAGHTLKSHDTIECC